MIAIFEHPRWLLAALAVLPAGLFFLARYRNIEHALLPLVSMGDGQPVRFFSRMILVRFVCLSLAWVLLSCAAASPRWGTALVASRQEGSSVLFVMDISRSMGVEDIGPDRLSYASRYAYLLTERMENIPCGVVLVKGGAVLAVPLTTDHRSVLDLLSSLSPALLSSPGTGLAAGIQTALSSFPRNSAAARTIILLTDGDETSGSLADAVRSVRTTGVTLIIVGIGTPSGAEINVYPGADEKRMETTRLREDLLKNAARSAGRDSFYILGTEAGSAIRVLEAAVPASGKASKLVYSPKPVYRYFEFLVAALGCICAAFIAGGLAWRKKK